MVFSDFWSLILMLIAFILNLIVIAIISCIKFVLKKFRSIHISLCFYKIALSLSIICFLVSVVFEKFNDQRNANDFSIIGFFCLSMSVLQIYSYKLWSVYGSEFVNIIFDFRWIVNRKYYSEKSVRRRSSELYIKKSFKESMVVEEMKQNAMDKFRLYLETQEKKYLDEVLSIVKKIEQQNL